MHHPYLLYVCICCKSIDHVYNVNYAGKPWLVSLSECYFFII